MMVMKSQGRGSNDLRCGLTASHLNTSTPPAQQLEAIEPQLVSTSVSWQGKGWPVRILKISAANKTVLFLCAYNLSQASGVNMGSSNACFLLEQGVTFV